MHREKMTKSVRDKFVTLTLAETVTVSYLKQDEMQREGGAVDNNVDTRISLGTNRSS